MSVTRRGFIRTVAIGAAGLTLGFVFSPEHALGADADASWTSAVNAWIAIGTDGTITIRVAQSEMGQGVIEPR